MVSQAYDCRSHRLRDTQLSGWNDQIAGRWSYRDLIHNPDWFHGWISFDALCWSENDEQLYCGLNSLDGDLLYRFDPISNCFTSLQTRRWTDRFDSKIHRTLLQNPRDGCLYFATSLLHDADSQHEAPGGKLVRYDPTRDVYDVLAIPEPHLYIQSIAADWRHNILYAFTYPAEFVVRFDMNTGQIRRLAYVGNAVMFAQPHNAVVDRNGWLWGTYAETRAWDENTGPTPIRLFAYDPDNDHFQWYEHGLSRRDDRDQLLSDPEQRYEFPQELTETRHKEDYGFCDSMVYDGHRYIYCGTVAGILCRIDTTNATVDKIAHVMPAGRLPALAIRENILYAAGGMQGQTQAMRWRIGSQQIYDLGNLVDRDTGERPARIHEIAVSPAGVVYLAENDNHHRSNYLWSLTPSSMKSI